MTVSLPQLQHELTTEQGFAARVKVPRAATGLATVLLVASLLAVGYNLLSTIQTEGAFTSVRTFLRVFFSTQGEDGASSFIFLVVVWAPLILIPLSLVVLGYAAVSHGRVKRQAFERYARRGYVAVQAPLGLDVQLTKEGGAEPLVLLSHPSLPDAGFAALVRDVRAHVAIFGPNDVGALTTALRASGVGQGVSLTSVFPALPGLPPQVVLTTRRTASAVVVIPPERPAPGTHPEILEIKG